MAAWKSIGFLFAIAAAPSGAQPISAEAASPPERTITLEVYGDDPCPAAQTDEIIVCARRPEEERYRIPKPLRNQGDRRPEEVSWGSRVEELEEVNRPSMPGSCSVVGAGGQTGCLQQMLRQWFADKRMRAR